MAGPPPTLPGGLSPRCRLRGLPAGSMPGRSWAHDARAEIGAVWLVRLVLGDLLVLTRGGDLSGEIQGPGRNPTRPRPPPGPSPDRRRAGRDTPGRFRGNRCWCRYGWSWPEPPAGGTPHHGRSRRALARTGACGQLGSRTANRMAVPLSPSIRERAWLARLRPARTTTTEEERMDVYCGIDWAEDHHDIALADRAGQLLARRRISDDAAGLAQLLALLAEHGDTADDPVPVAIETPRGLLTACLRATGRPVYPVNPMAVARYRARHSAAGRKSDRGDALVLANILRTDMHAHRP